MTRRPAHPISRLLAITATAVASGVVLLVLARTYGPEQFALSQSAVPEPVGTPPSESAVVSANPLELAVLDRPRAVPEIHFSDEQGNDLILADFRGRVVLLNIWATWCVPCRKEMPALDRLQAKLGGKDFIVIPLSIDRQGVSPVRRFYQELGLENVGILCRSVGQGVARSRDSGGADDITDRPAGARGGPQDGRCRMGRTGNRVAGRAGDARSIGQQWHRSMNRLSGIAAERLLVGVADHCSNGD